MNMLAHTNALVQEQYGPPTYIFKHFVRILNKYTHFLTLPELNLCFKVQIKPMHWRKMPD